MRTDTWQRVRSREAGAMDDDGGEAPCLLPVFEREVVTVDLATAADAGSAGGAVWSLPHDGDLDANLVVLHAGESIGAHVNREVDVLVVVRRGSATLTVDGDVFELDAGRLALVPHSRSRSIVAGDDGVEYLSIHRRRSGLRIS
jgi:quercetin dioxygenase-like cupin family protein